MAKSKNVAGGAAVAEVPTKVNKAKAIREFKEKNPDAKPAAIVAALKEQGIEISANYIATVNYHKNGSKKKGSVDFKEAYAKLRLATKACKGIGGLASAQKAIGAVMQLSKELDTPNIEELNEMVNQLADALSEDESVPVPVPAVE